MIRVIMIFFLLLTTSSPFFFINSNRPAKSYAGQFYYHIIYPESKYDYSLLAFLCIFQ